VYLAGGTYRLASAFQLGPQDSGQNGHTVYWQAVAGQTPVINGATQVSGWSQYDTGRNVWRAAVPAGTQSRQLWVNGVAATRARSAVNPGGFSLSGTSFTTGDSSYQSWTNVTQTEVVDDNDWKEMRCPLSGITRTGSGGSSLNVNPTCFTANSTNVGFPFNGNGLPTMNGLTWIENNLALLTQPGQWYLDSGAGYLYYIPSQGQNMASADVELPVVSELLALSGTPGHLTPVNDTASGISYTGSGWSYNAGRPFGDYDNDVHATTNNGDSVGYTRGATISHNTIAYEPYGGINLGWGWGWQSSCSMQSAQGLSACRHGTDYAGGNQILNNGISNIMLVLRDNAFIYTLGGQGGGNGTLTSVIAGNYGNGQGGVYPDEGSSWWQIQNNVWNITSGAAAWTYIWTPTVNNITFGTNYANVSGATNNGTNIHFTQATIVTNGQWPAAAQSIIANAGATPGGNTGGSFPTGYVQLHIASNSLCLDNYGNTSNAGAIIDQWTCGSQANQKFQFVPTSGGYGELQVQNSGQDVAVLGGSTTQGQTDIVQEPVTGNAASQWLPQQQSDGSWQFKNLGSGLCLDVYGAGSTNGQQLDQWPCKNAPGTNQDFNAR
jgi:hypothetical protein